MPHSDQLYNRISNLLRCYIQYPYLDRGEQLGNLDWIIANSGITVPANFDIYDHPDSTKLVFDKLTSVLFHVFVQYFEEQDFGEFTFRIDLNKVDGIKQQIEFKIHYDRLKFYITDISDNINPHADFEINFPHKIVFPVFLDEN